MVFVDNGGVRLHALDNARVDQARVDAARVDPGAPPVLVVPGMGEHAEEYAWALEELGDRRVVVVDVRGRGRSDAPANGYTWEDHIGDLRAVVDALAVDRPILVAFSRGSSYALGYALQGPDRVRGLVVGDYFARHVGLPVEFVASQLGMRVRGVPVSERMAGHVVRGVVTESREVPLWGRLAELQCPVLVIRGGRPGRVVTDDLAEQWRAALPSVELATVAAAGHDLWSRDLDAYLAVLAPFLAGIAE